MTIQESLLVVTGLTGRWWCCHAPWLWRAKWLLYCCKLSEQEQQELSICFFLFLT